MHWFLLASNFLFDLEDTLITKWSFVMSWARKNCGAGVKCHRRPCGFQHAFSLEYIHTHTPWKSRSIFWIEFVSHSIPFPTSRGHGMFMIVDAFLWIPAMKNLCWWASDWFMVLTPRTSCNGYAEPVGSVAHCWLHASWNLSRPVVVRCLVVAPGWGLNNPGTVLWSVAGQWVL